VNQFEDWRTRLQALLSDYVSRQAEIKAKARADGVKIDRIEAARAWHAELVDMASPRPAGPSRSEVLSFRSKISSTTTV
jgi:acyl-CoA dehydrogenase